MKTSRVLRWMIAGSIFFHLTFAYPDIPDSIPKEAFTQGNGLLADLMIATSFFKTENWKEQSKTYFLLASSFELKSISASEDRRNIFEFRAELSYNKFSDSIWTKANDNFFVSRMWVHTKGIHRHSLSISLKSQLTDTWDYSSKKPDGRPRWKSGPLLPSTLSAGYGVNIRLKNNSFINLSFASVKVNANPIYRKTEKDEKFLLTTDKYFLKSEYGFSAQGNIRKNIFRELQWDCRFLFFAKGIEKETTTFDFQNFLTLKVMKIIRVKLGSRLVYDKLESEKLQVHHELLFGYNLEMGKKTAGNKIKAD